MKKMLLFLWICLMCNALTGQGTGTLYYVPQSGVNNIVRHEPVTGKHIVYSQKIGLSGIESHLNFVPRIVNNIFEI